MAVAAKVFIRRGFSAVIIAGTKANPYHEAASGRFTTAGGIGVGGEATEVALQTGIVTGPGGKFPSNTLGGINQTFRGEVRGVGVIIKPESGLSPYPARTNIPAGTDIEREMAAYEVAKYMEIEMPATAIRDTPLGRASVQEWVDDASTGFEYADRLSGAPLSKLRQFDKTALFDAVIGNEDRHPGNFLVKGGAIIPIDNGLSFPNVAGGRGECNEHLIGMRVRKGRASLQDSEKALLKRMAADKGFRSRLDQTLNDSAGLSLMYKRINLMLETGRVREVTEMVFTSRAATPGTAS